VQVILLDRGKSLLVSCSCSCGVPQSPLLCAWNGLFVKLDFPSLAACVVNKKNQVRMKSLKPLAIWFEALCVCSLVPKDGFGLACSSAFTYAFVALVYC
jgi:hypothetical protein